MSHRVEVYNTCCLSTTRTLHPGHVSFFGMVPAAQYSCLPTLTFPTDQLPQNPF